VNQNVVLHRLKPRIFTRYPTPVSGAESGRDLAPPTSETAENLKN